MEGSEKEEDAEEILQKEGLIQDEDDYSDDYNRGHDQKRQTAQLKKLLEKLKKQKYRSPWKEGLADDYIVSGDERHGGRRHRGRHGGRRHSDDYIVGGRLDLRRGRHGGRRHRGGHGHGGHGRRKKG